MGAVTSALIAVASVASAGAQILGGLESRRESKVQAQLAREDAAKRAAETERVTTREAELERRNIKDVTERQRLAYLASGVTLEGSPLLKLEETRRLGAENIEEIERSGEARAGAEIGEGRVVARQAESRGRQQLLQGLVGGAGSLSRLR